MVMDNVYLRRLSLREQDTTIRFHGMHRRYGVVCVTVDIVDLTVLKG